MRLSSHEIAYLVLNAGFNESFEAPTMVAIVLATSGGDTDYLENVMYNDLQDQLHGLAAISSQRHSDQLIGFKNWRDGLENLKMAYSLFKNAGRNFGFWDAYNNGTYKDFMPVAHYGIENPVKPLPTGALQSEANGEMLELLTKEIAKHSRELETIRNSTEGSEGALAQVSRILSEIRAFFRA